MTFRTCLLVVPLAAGWLVSVRYRARQFNAREGRLLDRIDVLEDEAAELRHYWGGAQEAMDDAGVECPPKAN